MAIKNVEGNYVIVSNCNLENVLNLQIGHVNNCLAFADYVKRLRKLFLELEGQEQVKDESEEDDAIMIRKDQFIQLSEKFIDVGEFGYVLFIKHLVLFL